MQEILFWKEVIEIESNVGGTRKTFNGREFRLFDSWKVSKLSIGDYNEIWTRMDQHVLIEVAKRVE